MRNLTQIILLMISTLALGQEEIHGNYSNRFGEKIELKSDSTFVYTWRFDLASSWSKGNWSIENDTIYLDPIPIMDTLRTVKNNIKSDSLVLSSDQKGNRTTAGETLANALSGGGQNRKEPPQRLYFKNGRLYRITDNDEIDDKKHQQMSPGKKYKSYFYKTD